MDKTQPLERLGYSPQDRLRQLAQQQGLEGSLYSEEKGDALDRARRRAAIGVTRRQKNLEAILRRALLQSDNSTAVDELDGDWFYHFSRLSENIGNNRMQGLWANILLKELEQPGSFSRRALETLEKLSVKETMLFAKAVNMAMQVGSEYRLVIGLYRRHTLGGSQTRLLPLGQFGLPYSALASLMEVGLLQSSELVSADLRQHPVHFSMGGHRGLLAGTRRRVHLTYYRFSAIGDELARLVATEPDNKFETELTKLAEGELSLSWQ
ncbi:TIGR03899 family protein [Gallaecimonas kandeliae]|uniref:TIGR03899 family protein n=1 Tax=Gallaecimonas kandeliae TaxID=3029055 RepID=UPI002647F9FA|nr:TIGR03899 family protein [Gallaecimonas kandeliae]WKE66279.1 TIGR03899 family protein [Gallaecimonas kandeliae]